MFMIQIQWPRSTQSQISRNLKLGFMILNVQFCKLSHNRGLIEINGIAPVLEGMLEYGWIYRASLYLFPYLFQQVEVGSN